MGCGKDIAENEKVLAIMKIAKFRANISISEKKSKSLCDDRNI